MSSNHYTVHTAIAALIIFTKFSSSVYSFLVFDNNLNYVISFHFLLLLSIAQKYLLQDILLKNDGLYSNINIKIVGHNFQFRKKIIINISGYHTNINVAIFCEVP